MGKDLEYAYQKFKGDLRSATVKEIINYLKPPEKSKKIIEEILEEKSIQFFGKKFDKEYKDRVMRDLKDFLIDRYL